MASGSSNYSFFWDEAYWFPEKHGRGWKDLKNEPGSNTYYPQIEDLNWTILLGVLLIFVRYTLETLIVVPIAIRLGVPDKRKQSVTPNQQLEAAYKQNKTLHHSLIKGLVKQTDLSERQIEIWFRKRKKWDQPLPLQKFRECSWHLMFYSTFFIYGLVVLWNKPYFWKSVRCWEQWPKQHVSSDVYWYYVVELSFYWSLVFTLCTDNKRKDFKEMIIHHFATIVLMYFSWVLNFVRIGTIVLAVHDAADSWLALAKMSIYIKSKTATDVFFVIFLVFWVISRLIIYPYVVLYSTTVEPYTAGLMDKTFWAHWFFNFFLYLLQILHLIWTYLIFRIVYRKLIKGNVEDVRSDSEDSGDDSDDECEDVNENKNEKTVINGHRMPTMEDVKLNGNQNVVQSNGSPVRTRNQKGTSQNDGLHEDNNVVSKGRKSVSPSKIPRAMKH